MDKPIRIQAVDPLLDHRWDLFVENHPFGWICHLSSWKRVIENSFPHIKGNFLALLNDSGEKIEAALPFYFVNSWIFGRRLVSIPYATICDPLVSSVDYFDAFYKKLIEICRLEKCKSIEIRALNSLPYIPHEKIHKCIIYVHHYLMLNDSLDSIWKLFHRNPKYCIRKAKNNGITVKESEPDEIDKTLEVFYSLHKKTRKRLGLPLHPFKFLHNLVREFAPKKQLTFFIACNHGKPIGALLALKFKDRFSAEYIANDPDFREASPNHLLFWEAIKKAHINGFKIFDFGRTEKNNSGLMEFKSRWGTRCVDLPIFFWPDDINRKKYTINQCSKSIIRKLCKYAPALMQKYIGNFCYKHLG